MNRFKSHGGGLSNQEIQTLCTEYMGTYYKKFYWFLSHGYAPHPMQILFHGMTQDERLVRFRHLVAGRRGGKTLSAAWDVAYYNEFPEEWSRDYHGTEWNGEPLWTWCLSENYKLGRPSWLTFLSVLRQAGMQEGIDYKLNRGEKHVEFLHSGSLVEFKTADNPQTLRGAGLDILWMDEAAIITDQEAWDVVRPGLADKLGGVISTTTPKGKNWFYELFFKGAALEDPFHGSVEYWTIDNPHFPESEWKYEKEHTHPMIFAQEYMASFDAFAGVELLGDWLHYYTVGSATGGDVELPKNRDGVLALDKFMGIDPAVSLRDNADHFAMALIGLDKKTGMAYLLDTYLGRLPFPEQLPLIHQWFYKYRPSLIGIESNAFQKALAQMVSTMEGFPPVVPILSAGKKEERILRMSPLFQIGKVRIHKSQIDFIDQWISYDSELANPRDDLLDAVEIALRTAGALLPMTPEGRASSAWFDGPEPTADINALVNRELEDLKLGLKKEIWDYDLGSEW